MLPPRWDESGTVSFRREPLSSMAVESEGRPGASAEFAVKKFFIVVLLLLAGAHCTLSIFYDNEGWLNLQQYASGSERNPYQERAAMVPLLHWAAKLPPTVRWAHWLEARDRRIYSDVHVPPEELVSLIAALASVWLAIGACCLYGRAHMPEFWWLPATIMIAILYASYAARYEHALWFPYDLPHMFLFGAACACLLRGKLWLYLLCFTVDVPMRETSLFLVPLLFCLLGSRLSFRKLSPWLAASLFLWAAIRLPIMYLYRQNPSEVGNRLVRNLHALTYPADWPTIASSIGFLLIPIWLGRRHLDRSAQAFLWLTLPCLAVSAYFGILIETRIFVEWTIPFALIAATEVVAAIRDRPATLFIRPLPL